MVKRITPHDLLQREEFITFIKRLAAAQARAEARQLIDAVEETKDATAASAHRRRRRGRKKRASSQPADDGTLPD